MNPNQRVFEDYHTEDALKHLLKYEDMRLSEYNTKQLDNGVMSCGCPAFQYRHVCRHIDFFLFKQMVIASAVLRDIAGRNGGLQAMLDGIRRSIRGNPGASKSLRVSILMVAAAHGQVSASSLRDAINLDAILPPETNRNIIGATFQAMAREGLIIAIGGETSRQSSRHAGHIARWSLTPKGRNKLALTPAREDEMGETLGVSA
jgi:hypothetical protein